MPSEYAVLKHPKWRVAGWEDVASEVRDALIADIETHLNKFRYANNVADIEIVGGYAFRRARLSSDLDLNFCGKSWKHQSNIQWHMHFGFERTQIFADWQAIQEKHQIKIDFGFRNPDSRFYVPIYSCREQKFYNKKEGEIRDIHVVWDFEGHDDWSVVPYKAPGFKVTADPFGSEVVKWRERYGPLFQELEGYANN